MQEESSMGNRKSSIIGQPTKWQRVEVSRKQSYDVYLTANSYEDCCVLLNELVGDRQRLVITSPGSKMHGSRIWENIRVAGTDAGYLVLDCNESTKSIDQVLRVCHRAQEIRLSRQGVLVAVGGGVCTDIATVAASWLHRGIDYIKVPTTLTGQVDAGIGIKGAVNFHGKKSYLGCFHLPKAAIITPLFLQTLPLRHLRAGIAEILKMAIICDHRLFTMLEAHQRDLLASGFREPVKVAQEVLWHSIALMLGELEGNLYEDQTLQRKVDFGHTISPALEAISGFDLVHGEAVAIDMAFSTVLACHMRLLDWEVGMRILSVLLDMGLSIWLPSLTSDLCQAALQNATLHRGGKPNLVVPTEIGDSTFIDRLEHISDQLIEASLCTLREKSQEVLHESSRTFQESHE